jgi:hypothetical protein
VSGHPTRVPQAEVDERVPVHVPEARALGAIDEDGMVARPPGHPVHRDPEQQRRLRVLGELPRPGVSLAEVNELALHQLVHA